MPHHNILFDSFSLRFIAVEIENERKQTKDDLTQCQSLENEVRDVCLGRVCADARARLTLHIQEYTKRYHHRRRCRIHYTGDTCSQLKMHRLESGIRLFVFFVLDYFTSFFMFFIMVARVLACTLKVTFYIVVRHKNKV